MAFSGHMDSDGKVVWREEIYTGRTTIIGEALSSSPSDQSEASDNNYLPPQPWQHLNSQEANSLLYGDHQESSSSSSAPLSLPPAQDGNYIHRKYNTDSIYSWTDMYGSLKPVESQSNVVPSLELHSKTSTLDYLRDLDGLKLPREPQVAYETWYASKQRLRQQELQRQKEEREEKQLKENERKHLAKICYDKWLSDKTRAKAQKVIQKADSVISCSSDSRTVRNVPQTQISQVVESWWHKKQEQQQQQRLEKQRHLQKKEWENQRRKQLASLAWQKWMSNVYDKPKPVPMNQGIDSLRGTVSPLYVNPVPWKPLKKASEKP